MLLAQLRYVFVTTASLGQTKDAMCPPLLLTKRKGSINGLWAFACSKTAIA